MHSKTYPRTSLRASDAPAARPPRWARFGGEICMRSIPLRHETRDDFPLYTVPSNIPITYRHGNDRYMALPGTFIDFPANHLSSMTVLHILPDGSEENIPAFLHPRYSIPAMPFQPSPAWAEPDESPSAPPTTAVEEDDIQRHARLANAAAERRVVVYTYLESWLIGRVLADVYGIGSRESFLLQRKIAAAGNRRTRGRRASSPTPNGSPHSSSGRAEPDVPIKAPIHVRTILDIASRSSAGSSGLAKRPAFAVKDKSLISSPDTAKRDKRVYRDNDELRNLLKVINKNDAAHCYQQGLDRRRELLQAEAAEGAYPVPVAGTNQILVGLALVDRSSEDGSATLIGQGLPHPAVTVASASTSPPAHSPTATSAPLPDPVNPSGNLFDTNNPNPSLDVLSIDELRAKIAHGESLIAQSAENLADLDADIAGIEAILETEDSAATEAPTPGFISAQSADAVEAILRRQEDRERARAERVATEGYRQRSANQARRSSTSASVPPPSSTPPRPLPRALIPLRNPLGRRGRDASEHSTNTPSNPPQATLPASLDRPCALRRQHAFHERMRPEPLREEAYTSPFSALSNLSESNRRAIEARLETENMRRQQSSADGQDDASLPSPDSPKRKRSDEDEDGSPTTKRARSESPPPVAEVAPVTSNTPPSSPKRKRDDDSNAEHVAFADQTVVRSPPEGGSPAAKRARLDSPAAETAPVPSSPTPSLKRRRSEDEEEEAAVEQALSLPSPPSPPPSEEGGSPTKRARSSGWCNIA